MQSQRASSADCVIGVDLGTQGVRGLAVASNGSVIARAAVPLPLETQRVGPDGAFEQDAEKWWQVTCIMLSQIGEQLTEAGTAPDAVKALCITGTSGTFVPLDSSHRPLRPALMYNDGRALAEVHRCNSILSNLTAKLGFRFNASFALPKLLWLYIHEPEAGGAAHSQLWLRIRASVCNRPFIVPVVADAAMGAAMLAATGRLHPDLRSATQAMVRSSNEVTPDPSWVPIYEERYARFKDELHARGYLSKSV